MLANDRFLGPRRSRALGRGVRAGCETLLSAIQTVVKMTASRPLLLCPHNYEICALGAISRADAMKNDSRCRKTAVMAERTRGCKRKVPSFQTAAARAAPRYETMTSRLQLHLSAKDLKNLKGIMGRSDPFAVVTVRGDNRDGVPHIVGQTEVYVGAPPFGSLGPSTHLSIDSVFKNLNPTWSRTIFLEGYKFGVDFYIEVGVFDFDVAATSKSEAELSRMDLHSQAVITKNAGTRELMRKGTFPHKVIGTALFEVGEILGSKGNVRSKSLQTGGAVFAHIERCSTNASVGQLNFQLQSLKLHNVQSLGRTSSPFYELYRRVDRPKGATWMSVYRSNVVRSDLNPLWTEVTLDMEATCHGDLDRAMKVIVWDYRKTGKHKLMGECETTIRGFLEAKADPESVDDEGFILKKLEQEVGTLQVIEAQLIGVNRSDDDREALESVIPTKTEPKRPEFVDYLSGGCQISLAVAIDFTASNGDPRQPGTPHHFHPPESKEWNDYEKAIFAVGSIFAKYDSDQRFPVWGFGAKYNNVVRQCFQCGTEVEVEGVQGIMDAYRGVFRTPLTMSYPTKFTEVIQTAASYARHEQVSQITKP